MSARPLRRLAVAAAAGTAVLLALPVAAGAHVEAEAETVEGVTTVTFGFHHGCDGAATTGLRIQLPEGATDVEPQDVEGWTSEVSGGELSWSGGSVADGAEGTFTATMVLTDPEGTTVFLPTIQQCGTAQSAWIDKSDDPEATNAAPRIVAGAAMPTTGHDKGDDDHGSAPSSSVPEKTTNGADPGTTATTAADRNETASPPTEAASSTSSSNAPLIIGIVAAVVVIAGLIAFLVTRKGSSSAS